MCMCEKLVSAAWETCHPVDSGGGGSRQVQGVIGELESSKELDGVEGQERK